MIRTLSGRQLVNSPEAEVFWGVGIGDYGERIGGGEEEGAWQHEGTAGRLAGVAGGEHSPPCLPQSQ